MNWHAPSETPPKYVEILAEYKGDRYIAYLCDNRVIKLTPVVDGRSLWKRLDDIDCWMEWPKQN